MSYHLRYAELSGTLCSGDLLPMKATYALAADKVKNRIKMNRDETLAMLARKYFRSRQPATLEDFVWWSGLNVSDCRRGIEILGDYLHVAETQNFASLPLWVNMIRICGMNGRDTRNFKRNEVGR